MLWLSAALAAIAFSLSSTVRGETERTSTEIDGLRSYYLAVGGVYRAAFELLWSVTTPDKRMIPKGSVAVNYEFPSGDVRVEFIPEAAKLDVNKAPVEQLTRLVAALGVDPMRAQEIAQGIDARRGGSGGLGIPDITPTFQPSHASFQEIEELLAVTGVTPDIFYGTYVPGTGAPGEAGLEPRGGLLDCLSVYGSNGQVDANTASPAVLAAIGLSPYAVSAIVEHCRQTPFTAEDLPGFAQSVGADMSKLRVEGHSMVTIRATARLRNADGKPSDLKRTVAAVVKYVGPGADFPIHFVRWYDTAWSY
ncbi:MAG TPA: hypothetical protein VGF59_35445 [Bryobacteraceae bacterium]